MYICKIRIRFLETLLEENWTDTIVSLPDGANRWPNAPEIMVTNSSITTGKLVLIYIKCKACMWYKGTSDSVGSPNLVKTVPKYSTKGGFNKDSFRKLGIKNNLVLETLVSTANGSLASATWRKYGYTSLKINRVGKKFGVDMSFPFDQTKTLLFISYSIQKGHLTSTIEGYLSCLLYTSDAADE